MTRTMTTTGHDGKTRYWKIEQFLTLDRDGHVVVSIPEHVMLESQSEYAAWYEQWELVPGNYRVGFWKKRPKPASDPWGPQQWYAVDDPAEADDLQVVVHGTLMGGDLGSRFGGVRVGRDPVQDRIGKVEQISFTPDVAAVVAVKAGKVA